jgi:hypothetical protein
VAESYAHLNTRRSNSIVMQSWVISDKSRFDSFIRLTQEKIDFLVNLMDVKEKVDRAMRMDIRNFGWHLTADRMRVAQDVSKLKLITQACQDDYPEYLIATQQALDQITRENRENSMGINIFASKNETPATPTKTPTTVTTHETPSSEQHPSTPPIHAAHSHASHHDKTKRPSMFGGLFKFKSFRKSKESVPQTPPSRGNSVSGTPQKFAERSLSDAGPVQSSDGFAPLEPIRSKSVDHRYVPPPTIDALASQMGRLGGDDVEAASSTEPIQYVEASDYGSAELEPTQHMQPLHQVDTIDTIREADVPGDMEGVGSHISRHDQYHGIARTETRDLRQGNM